MASAKQQVMNGIIHENPVFVQVLGMCPTLAVTTSAINGMGMGLATMAVLIGSNTVIALLRNIIPKKVRIPAYIVVIASFVTLIDFLLNAYMNPLHDALGLFIPLIVVNCIVLGRAEAFASKNTVGRSLLDGFSMGIGFTLALTVIGMVRELLGVGSLFDVQVMPSFFEPIAIFVLAPGAFIVLGLLFATFNFLNHKLRA